DPDQPDLEPLLRHRAEEPDDLITRLSRTSGRSCARADPGPRSDSRRSRTILCRCAATLCAGSRLCAPQAALGRDTRGYLPVNAGLRFSRKCATPSAKSSLLKLSAISRSPVSIASPSVWNRDSHSWRFITRIDLGDTASTSSPA